MKGMWDAISCKKVVCGKRCVVRKSGAMLIIGYMLTWSGIAMIEAHTSLLLFAQFLISPPFPLPISFLLS